MKCRFCQQEGIHYCPGGKLQPGDREFDLYGETRAFPGLADAADHFEGGEKCPAASTNEN
jgi:hypothetical protein